jgi:hypothetical protein
LQGKLKGNNLVIPLYAAQTTEPAAILRVDQVLTEYEKRGFFRIGVLPRVVLQGVRLEVRQPEAASRVLEHACQQLEAAARRRPVELRQLEVALPERRFELKAASLRVGTRGAWAVSALAWQAGPNARELIPSAELRFEPGGATLYRTPDRQKFLKLSDLLFAPPRKVPQPPSNHEP